MKKLLIVLLAGLLTLPFTASAQVRTIPSGAAAAPAGPPEKTFDEIKFEGGVPEDLMTTLNEASDRLGLEKPNVIISPDLQNTTIPPFELHNVSLSDVFNALNMISQAANTGTFWQQSSVSPNRVWTFVTTKPQPNYGIPMTAIPGQVQQPKPPKGCQIFHVGHLLEKYKIEDVTTAIRTAWGLLEVEDKPKPELRFHQDTELLIAVGYVDDLRLVDNVLRELEKSLVGRPGAKAEPAPKQTEPKRQ